MNSSPAVKRIHHELQLLENNPVYQSIYHIEPVSEDNPFQLRGFVNGPPDSLYQNGVFRLEISLPQDYPFGAPTVRMTTKVWHHSIGDSGNIPLEEITDWTPDTHIHSLMIGIQALLSSLKPNFWGSINLTVTNLMKRDIEMYQKTAAFWTYHYAVSNPTEQMRRENAPLEAMIRRVMYKSDVSYDQALDTLSRDCWMMEKSLVVRSL